MNDFLSPIGFVDNTKTPVYYKEDIMSYLLEVHNGSSEVADDYYEKYWKNNKELIIILKVEKKNIFSPTESDDRQDTMDELEKIIKFLNQNSD